MIHYGINNNYYYYIDYLDRISEFDTNTFCNSSDSISINPQKNIFDLNDLSNELCAVLRYLLGTYNIFIPSECAL